MGEISFPTEKESELLNFKAYWKPFKIDSENLSISNIHGRTWPVKNFVKTNVRVRGILIVKQLYKNVWVLGAEIISKSNSIRALYRYIIIDQLVLVEEDENGICFKIFQDFICPLLKIGKSTEIRVNVMRNRSLAKKGIPIRLTILVNNQTAGVEGLEQMTLTGDNVIRGIQTLHDRQEVDLKADSIGPWIDVETKDLRYRMGKGIFVKNTTEMAFSILKATLD